MSTHVQDIVFSSLSLPFFFSVRLLFAVSSTNSRYGATYGRHRNADFLFFLLLLIPALCSPFVFFEIETVLWMWAIWNGAIPDALGCCKKKKRILVVDSWSVCPTAIDIQSWTSCWWARTRPHLMEDQLQLGNAFPIFEKMNRLNE